MSDNSLYSRQKSLALMHYKYVFVVGCGGIGNWVALDLALSGCVQNLYVIDPDVVEESNLNRTIFDYCDIGAYKTDCIARQIVRRRPDQDVNIISEYMTDELVDTIIKEIFLDNSYYHTDICIVDCRDDIYEDVFRCNCKLYKVGYDGVEITIDGNPRLTKVFGQRGGSYTVTPSYICSSQLAANLVVNDMLYPKCQSMLDKKIMTYNDLEKISEYAGSEEFSYLHERPNGEYDEFGRLNDSVSLNTTSIPFMYFDNPSTYKKPELQKDKNDDGE